MQKVLTAMVRSVAADPHDKDLASALRAVSSAANSVERLQDYAQFEERMRELEKRQDLIDRVRREGSTDRVSGEFGYEETVTEETNDDP